MRPRPTIILTALWSTVALVTAVSALAVPRTAAAAVHMCPVMSAFPSMRDVTTTNASCATARAFHQQLVAASYQGDEDAMWRPLRTLRDEAGRAYSCRYKVIARSSEFYSWMVCARGRGSVVARVNAS